MHKLPASHSSRMDARRLRPPSALLCGLRSSLPLSSAPLTLQLRAAHRGRRLANKASGRGHVLLLRRLEDAARRHGPQQGRWPCSGALRACAAGVLLQLHAEQLDVHGARACPKCRALHFAPTQHPHRATPDAHARTCCAKGSGSVTQCLIHILFVPDAILSKLV